MPFAGYANFEACVVAQKGKGHSDESAHKICGYLKAKTEKNMDTQELIAKEVWSTAYRNSLNDSCFLYVESGGTKEDGKTTPRSLRHFPVKDKNGNVDQAHVKNALARIPQSKLPADVKAKAKSKAERMLSSSKKTEKAAEIIAKARLVIKPTNPNKYIVGNIQPTGSASMDPKKAGKLNDVRGLKKDGGDLSTGDLPPPVPVQEDEKHKKTEICTYCGSEYTARSMSDEGNATGMILTGTDMLPTASATDGTPVQKHVEFAVKLQKSEEADEEHYVLGVVLEPEVQDTQGDIYSAEEIRKSAHLFMQNFGHIGLQHEGHIDDRAKILESYIAPSDFLLNEQKITKGTWLLGARILDDALWQSIKKGEITSWSIGGSAIRTPVEAVA